MNIYDIPENARVDIINNNKDNSIEILNATNDVDIDYPNWFKRNTGSGVVLQTKIKSFDIKFKCINDGKLTIYLRGPDVRNKFGRKVPKYVDFINFKVNNDIIKKNAIVWHDNPYIFEKDVQNGEIIELHCDWTYYKAPMSK